MEKRKFTKVEKLNIIIETSEQGIVSTHDKYGVYPATYYSCGKKYETTSDQQINFVIINFTEFIANP